MTRKLFIVVLGLAASVFSTGASGATGSASGRVRYIYTYGDGSVLVTGFTFATATCSNNTGFWIDASHPNFSRLYAIILAARATNAQLDVVAKIDNCWYPQVTSDASTYLVTYPE